MDRFDICLAQTLEYETSYKQPIGGPFIRWKATKKRPQPPLITGKPDGLGYDDDPNDTGGRTCMGIIQREYDAWRRNAGRPTQDVWRIGDDELTDIYRRQYWQPGRCAQLPPGLDFMVFDASVNCGVGIGARLLQRALGVKDDGHIGQVTISAANAVNDLEAVLHRFAEKREAYFRACRTFKHHGTGWLRRNDEALEAALSMARTGVSQHLSYVDFAEGSRKALPPAPVEAVADTATGQREIVQAGGGGMLSLTQTMELYGKANETGLIQTVLANPGTVALILLGIGLILNARFGWIDRGKKLILGV